MKDNIDIYEEVVKYLKTTIRDKYKTFDKAHDVDHFDEVFTTCAKLAVADEYSIEELITIKIAAAYHDIGLIDGYETREWHELLAIPYLVEDEELERLLKQKHKHSVTGNNHEFNYDKIIENASRTIRNHRTKYEATCEMDQILKDADSVSLLDKNRTILRVVYFYMDNIYKPGDDIIKIVNNRFEYINTTLKKKMETKFKSMAAVKIGLKPQWTISDITKDDVASLILSIKKPDIDLFPNT